MQTDNFSEISTRKADSVTVSSALIATQVLRLPWASPVGGKAVIKKIQITTSSLSGVTVMFWDADLSNTTPTTRGTGTITGSFFNVGVGAATGLSGRVATTLTLSGEGLPQYEFEAGVAIAVSDTMATQVGVEVEIV